VPPSGCLFHPPTSLAKTRFFTKHAQRGGLHRAGVRACLGCSATGPVDYTGHFSSFQAISQNIHSYRELMTNELSMRAFSSSPAVFAH
jgi:hypothetical protein